MLMRPSILKSPLAQGPYKMGGSACGYHASTGCYNYSYSNSSSCLDCAFTPPPPPKDDGCSWTLGIGAVGVGATVGIAIT